jgi:MYXO-CTERM domain-containing protein
MNRVETGGSTSGIAWLPLLGVLALGVAVYVRSRQVK